MVAHGITFIRTGICNQCGACGCSKVPCQHHHELDGKHFCDIYYRRDIVCKKCSQIEGEKITHQTCIAFPDNPWVHVIRQGRCGFAFERVDGRSMDDLPFLDGKPWQ